MVPRRKLSRGEVLGFFEAQTKVLVGIEACGTGPHWAGEIAALGHEAICEAVTRRSMQVVPIKAPEQQAALMMHCSRALLVGQRTALASALRGRLAEFGIVNGSCPGAWPRALSADTGDLR